MVQIYLMTSYAWMSVLLLENSIYLVFSSVYSMSDKRINKLNQSLNNSLILWVCSSLMFYLCSVLDDVVLLRHLQVNDVLHVYNYNTLFFINNFHVFNYYRSSNRSSEFCNSTSSDDQMFNDIHKNKPIQCSDEIHHKH